LDELCFRYGKLAFRLDIKNDWLVKMRQTTRDNASDEKKVDL